jgi:response regulator RpfG family c-di-GMP phosphodiesterase
LTNPLHFEIAMKVASSHSTVAIARGHTVQDFSASVFLNRLRNTKLIHAHDWDALAASDQRELHDQTEASFLLAKLLKKGLLTEYQAEQLKQGSIDDLILGNYRILDFLGSGGMGVVFKAEHHLLRRPVAIKILSGPNKQDSIALARFLNEVWVLGQLQHPHIVNALDAGEIAATEAHGTASYYFVMEYVSGDNLDDLVQAQGPLDPAYACDLVYQIADALAKAHRHQLVHRDVKPANIRVTKERQAKLLDFGVTRILDRRMTEPGMILGSLAYLAPEQAQAPGSVDIRADIYGLGGTLYWCLTGQPPFPPQGNPSVELAQRFMNSPPRVRKLRPEIPLELDHLVTAMLATRREDRPGDPQAVQRALVPFFKARTQPPVLFRPTDALVSTVEATPAAHRVLVADDEASNRNLCRLVLESIGLTCVEAANGKLALDAIQNEAFDLVLLDIDMPAMTGTEVLRRLREAPPTAHLKIIMLSGRSSADDMSQMMLAGADNYLTKPFSATQLQAHVTSALRLKDAQVRSDTLFRSLLTVNHELEQNLNLRDSDLVQARNALVLALAELVAYRDTETGAHLMRLQRYSRCLAEKMASTPGYASLVDTNFIGMLECCAPLHDIGKAGVPDHILLKPGKLDAEERIIMQSHTTIGANILEKVAREHGFAKAFLKMATDITRHHHERFDGQGYPDRLVGDAIPLAARIVAIGDVYDAMRSRRIYKPALPHAEVVRIMLTESAGHFDPALLLIFQQCADRFDQLYRELVD